MRRKILTEVISSLLLFLFLFVTLSKILDFSAFKSYLNKSPFIGDKAAVVALAFPITAGIVSILLFFPRTRLRGMYGATVLLGISTLYLANIVFFSPHQPCSCGGLLKQLTATQHLVINVLFLLLSVAGIVMLQKLKRRAQEKEMPPVVFT